MRKKSASSKKRTKKQPSVIPLSFHSIIILTTIVLAIFSGVVFENMTTQSDVLGAATTSASMQQQSGFSFSNFFSSLFALFSGHANSIPVSPKNSSVQITPRKPIQIQNQSGQGIPMQGQQRSQMSDMPPQGAITACSGQNTGASCSFTTPNGSISGICQTPPNQTAIICVPSIR